MGKGYASAVLTAADSNEQQRYFAVEIGYSTALRVTNFDQNISISGNTYYPWSMDVLEPTVDGQSAHNATVVMSNLPGVTLPGAVTSTPMQKQETFESYALNTQVTSCGFTKEYEGASSPDQQVRLAGYSGKGIRDLNDYPGYYSWDAPGTVDSDITYFRVKFKALSSVDVNFLFGLWFCWDPTGGGDEGDAYRFNVKAGNINIARVDAGSFSTLETNSSFTMVADTWYTAEVTFDQSTGDITGRVWPTAAYSSVEEVSTTDTNYTSGKVGVACFNQATGDDAVWDQVEISYFDNEITNTYDSQIAVLDIDQDSRGKTMKIYECTVASGSRTDTLVFDGYVDEFSAADDSGTCRFIGVPKETQGSRPGSNFCMSICRWREFGGDDCQYGGTATSCDRTLVDCRKKVGEATITGSGLDDMTTGGEFSGSEITYYQVMIDSTGTPDTFRWSDDGGSTWDATNVAITGSAQTLNNDVTITFAATTGHTDTNYWDFQASWEDYFGNLLHAPAAGTIIEIDTYSIQVPQGGGGYYRVPIEDPPPPHVPPGYQPPPQAPPEAPD